MPAFTAAAPGKVILFGEHAVVYGRPAVAAPVSQVQARAVVMAAPRAPAGQVHIEAPNINLDTTLDQLPEHHPLAVGIQALLKELQLPRLPACNLRITSTIPIAAGLGSGAAVSVAVLRALAAFAGRPLPPERISALAFEVEKLLHGTPSGIDNTVVTYACPVYFVRGQPLERLQVLRPFTLVIGDSGVAFPTAVAVSDLRAAWQADPSHYESLFDEVGRTAWAGRETILTGQPEALGPLMDENQALLRELGVSSPELDRLVGAARQAGALGAKLSGGGRGGNMIALARAEEAAAVAQALTAAGAVRTITTVIKTRPLSQE